MEPVIFVSDPTDEGERLGAVLRARGYVVVDVPAEALVERAVTHAPSLIVLDFDSTGARRTLEALRAVPGAEQVHLLVVGEMGKALDEYADRIGAMTSGMYLRPVDAYAVLRRVESLLGPPSLRPASPHSPTSGKARQAVMKTGALLGIRPSSPPPAPEAPSHPGSSPRGSRPPAARLSYSDQQPDPAQLPAPPRVPDEIRAPEERPREAPVAAPMRLSAGPRLPTPAPTASRAPPTFAAPPRDSAPSTARAQSFEPGAPPMGILPAAVPLALGADESLAAAGRFPQAQLSPELQRLLASAEERARHVSRTPSRPPARPSPEDELDTVLPEDVLAALEEPLEGLDDDDDESDFSELGGASRPPRTAEARTGTQAHAGRAAERGTTMSETGPGTGARSVPGQHAAPAAEPATPSTGEGAEGPASITEAPRSLGPTRPPPRSDRNPNNARETSTNPPPYPAARFSDGVASLKPPELGSSLRPGSLPRHSNPAQAGWGSLAPASADSRPRSDRPTPEPNVPGALGPAQASGRPLGGRWSPSGLSPRRPSPEPSAPSAAPKPSPAPAVPPPPEVPGTLGPGDAVRALARLVRSRYSGSVAFESADGIRRLVLRDGDFVTAAAGIDAESLVSFLVHRGALSPDLASSLGRRIPQFGRHAGAALVAHGHLRQDELWPVLRAHAEWLVGRTLTIEQGALSLEEEPPARLKQEPAVFGGATGAEVLVELVRRCIAPELATSRMGGPRAGFAEGPAPMLLTECGLREQELALVTRSKSVTIEELLATANSPDFASVLYALCELGVLDRVAPSAPQGPVAQPVKTDELDDAARRARVLARKALVDEGDYFSLLGVARSATSYDVERAYQALQREFDPQTVLTPKNLDLRDDVDLILEVLEEAFEILNDPVRRERYRKALEARPA